MSAQRTIQIARPSRIAAAALLSGLLAACSGSTNTTPAGAGPGPGPTPGPNPGGAAIVAWGDSWTSGVGAVQGKSYPDQLQSLIGRQVFNGGVSGQTSDQIAARQGGAPALLTLPSDTMPGAGPVTVQDQSTFPISPEGPGPITGALEGIHGTLSLNGNLVFARDIDGAPVNVPAQSPFAPDTFGSRSKINVFWIGGNNFYDPAGVKSDTAKSVAFLSTSQFIILALLNAGSEPRGSASYDQITRLNSDLAAAYPGHYVDIREILVNHYDPSSAQDVLDHNNDVPPTSLRNDDQHPNEAGYAIVAQQVAAFIRNEGW